MSILVRYAMTDSPHTISPEMNAADAAAVMKAEELVGIISLGDVAWADSSAREVGEALRSISESEKTRTTNEDALRGTPQRVKEERGR